MQFIKNEEVYLSGLNELVQEAEGAIREDRTKTGTISTFGKRFEYDIRNGAIPLLSTKFVSFKSIVHELIWMLNGEKSIKYLKDNGVKIWDQWLIPGTEVYDDAGNLIDGISSSIYGEGWRSIEDTRCLTFSQLADIPTRDTEGLPLEEYELEGEFGHGEIVTREIDQIKRVLWYLRNNPKSRRIILNAWNPSRVADVILPPCHMMAQFYVNNSDELECQVYLRSNDYFLGAPFNIVQYSLLTHLLAAASGRKAAKLVYVVGDMHLYVNHIEQAKQQLAMPLMDNNAPTVKITVDPDSDLFDLHIDQFQLEGYESNGAIKAPIAV